MVSPLQRITARDPPTQALARAALARSMKQCARVHRCRCRTRATGQGLRTTPTMAAEPTPVLEQSHWVHAHRRPCEIRKDGGLSRCSGAREWLVAEASEDDSLILWCRCRGCDALRGGNVLCVCAMCVCRESGDGVNVGVGVLKGAGKERVSARPFRAITWTLARIQSVVLHVGQTMISQIHGTQLTLSFTT